MPAPRRTTLAFAAAVAFAAAAPPPVPASENREPAFTQEEIAAAILNPGVYTIDELSVTIKKVGPAVNPTEITPPADVPGTDDTVIIDHIINLFSKIWTIIEKNKPVVDVRTQYAAAIPEGVKHWGSLDGWKPPKGTIYQLTATNKFGADVIDVRYQVLRTYGGQYKGKGRYLTAVTVEPLKVDVAWGFKFTMVAEVPDTGVINVGTAENPIAGAMATLRWQIQSPLQDTGGKGIYFLQGDGLFLEVGGPFQRKGAPDAAKAVEAGLRALSPGR